MLLSRAHRIRLARSRRAGPALVRNRNHEPHFQPLRSEILAHLPVELALDDHADELGTEAATPAALWRRPLPLLPLERECETKQAPMDQPGDFDPSAWL